MSPTAELSAVLPLPTRRAPARPGLWHLVRRGWSDLFAPAGDSRAAAPRCAAAPGVRYRHPVTGLGWDGHGPQPQWLRDALLREGYLVDALRQAARHATSPQ